MGSRKSAIGCKATNSINFLSLVKFSIVFCGQCGGDATWTRRFIEATRNWRPSDATEATPKRRTRNAIVFFLLSYVRSVCPGPKENKLTKVFLNIWDPNFWVCCLTNHYYQLNWKFYLERRTFIDKYCSPLAITMTSVPLNNRRRVCAH